MKPLCHLNGHIMPVTQARIDPLDRGFMFGDSLYEGVKVLRGVPLFLEAHLARLRKGLERVEIPFPTALAADCLELLKASELVDGFLYLQITRGVAPRAHQPPTGLAPTVFLLPTAWTYSPPATRPRRAISIPDPRWIHCDLKTTSLMATVLSRMPGVASDPTPPIPADEILFVGEQGEIREGGNTSFFVRYGDLLQTHPLDGTILPGVTRSLVFDLAAELGIEVRQQPPLLSRRDDWGEAFVCGTVTGVEAVVELDGSPICGGGVGLWTQRLAVQLAALEEQRGEPRGD